MENMKIDCEITDKGDYVLLRDDGSVVSEHNGDKEALQAANNAGPGDFILKRPDCLISLRIVQVAGSEPEPPVDPDPPTELEPPSGDNPFNALYPAGFKLPTMAADSIPNVTRPARSAGLNDFVRDAVTGVAVCRVCDAKAEGGNDQLRHDYSRRQAFSAKDPATGRPKYFNLIDGNGQSYVYDAATLQKIKSIPVADGNCDPCWHPTDPALLRHTDYTGGLKWYELNVETGERTVLFDFAGKTLWPNAARFWTKAEGSFSADGRYICLMAMTGDASYTYLGMVCLDVVEKKIVGTLSGGSQPDHVSMSACGRWCIYSGAQTIAYPRDFDNPSAALLIQKEPFERKLGIALDTAEGLRSDPGVLDVIDDWDEAAAVQRVLYARSEHSDLGFDKDGRSVIVHAVFASGPNEGWIVSTDIETGVHTRVVRIYDDNHGSTTVHISAQCFDRPGWCVVSSYDDYSNYGTYPASPMQPLHRKVSLHTLDGLQHYTLAYIHGDKSVGNAYFHEPQATVSRDGTQVMFASSYSSPGPSPAGQPEAYMIALPDSVFEEA